MTWRREVSVPVRWLETVVVLQAGIAPLGSFGFNHHVICVLLLLPAAASPKSLGRRALVITSLALLAPPKVLFGGGSLVDQQCVALLLVLLAVGSECVMPGPGTEIRFGAQRRT